MGRIIPTDIKDPYELLATGNLLLEVTGAAEGAAGKEGEEVYAIQVTHVVIEPQAVRGMEYDETFFIGIHENNDAVRRGKLKADPNAELPETWQARAGGFAKYCAKHGFGIEGADLDLVFQTLVGKKIIAHIAHVASKTKKEDGTPYVNARADRWFAVGEVTPELTTETTKGMEVPPAQAGKAPAARGPMPTAAPQVAAPAPAASPASTLQANPAGMQPTQAAPAPGRKPLPRLGK